MRAVALLLLLGASAILASPSPRLKVKHTKAAPPLPLFPPVYTAEATMILPYADISEPLTYYYDSVNGLQRVDYYGGMDSYIMNVAANMTYQIMPMGYNSTGCLYINGPVGLQSLFPDLSPFSFQNTISACPGIRYAAQSCNVWTYVNVIMNKTNTYTFYATASSPALPVRYEMMGYDSLFGSHYDQYIVEYGAWDDSAIDSAVFAPPSDFPCTPFPGSSGPSIAGGHSLTLSHPFHDFNPTPHSKPEAAHIEPAFQQWKEKMGREYESHAHHEKRKQIFHNNLRLINAINRQRKSYSVALNHWADLTGEERRARFALGTRPPPKEGNGATGLHLPPSAAEQAALPSAVDWRGTGAVSAVKDQGVCGSCWSFGAHQTIEGAHFMKTGQAVRLSSQSLVDCSWPTGNTGCDGGNDFLAYQWIMQYNGGKVPTELSYPYLMANAQCHADRSQTGATITGYVNVTSGSAPALMQALATKGPISVSIDASHDSLSFYSSGVYYEPACENGVDQLDHTVLAVGYGTSSDGQAYWIVKNSWSSHWGDQGYVYMSQLNNNCGVTTAPTYVTM